MLLAGAALVAGPALAQLQTLRQSDVTEAAQQHGQVVAEFGGALTGPRASYVESVGRRVAAQSGTANAGQIYHFTTLNSAVENAFSVPGGYVYITRQLMGLMGDEAELAFVLGHETGHVAADHSRSRQARSQRGSIIGVLGAIVGGVFGGGFGDLVSQGLQQFGQLSTLKFSRAQEYEADQLGIRYITQAGYDPSAGATMLNSLTRASALEARVQGKAGRSTPEWASTHPLSENRSVQALQIARATGRAGQGLRNRDAFLARLDGVTVDDDPAQGVIEGTRFTHPDLRLQFTVPVGFQMQNGTDTVTIAGRTHHRPRLRRAVQRRPAILRHGGDAAANRRAAAGADGSAAADRGQRHPCGLHHRSGADERRRGRRQHLRLSVEPDHRLSFHHADPGRGRHRAVSVDGRFIAPHHAIRPRVISIATVHAGDTLQSLAGRMAYRDFQLERFLSLNNLTSASRLTPGAKVKLIVYGARG